MRDKVLVEPFDLESWYTALDILALLHPIDEAGSCNLDPEQEWLLEQVRAVWCIVICHKAVVI